MSASASLPILGKLGACTDLGNLCVWVEHAMIGARPLAPLCTCTWTRPGTDPGVWLSGGNPVAGPVLDGGFLPMDVWMGATPEPDKWGDGRASHRYLVEEIEITTSPTYSTSGPVPWPDGPDAGQFTDRHWKWTFYWSPEDLPDLPAIIVGWADFLGGEFYRAVWTWGPDGKSNGSYVITPEGADIQGGINAVTWAVQEWTLNWVTDPSINGEGEGTLTITDDNDVNEMLFEGWAEDANGEYHTTFSVKKWQKFALWPRVDLDPEDPERTGGLWEITKAKLDSIDLTRSLPRISGWNYVSGLEEDRDLPADTTWWIWAAWLDGGSNRVKRRWYHWGRSLQWGNEPGAPDDQMAPVAEGSTPENPILPSTDGYFWRNTWTGTRCPIIQAGITRGGWFTDWGLTHWGADQSSTGDWRESSLVMSKGRFTEMGLNCKFTFSATLGFQQTDPNSDDGLVPTVGAAPSCRTPPSQVQLRTVHVRPEDFLYNPATEQWEFGTMAIALQSQHHAFVYTPPDPPGDPAFWSFLPDFWAWPPCCGVEEKGVDLSEEPADVTERSTDR